MFEVTRKLLCQVLPVLVLLVPVSSLAAMVNGEELIDPTAPFLLDMENAGTQPVANMFAGFNNYDVSSILIRENLRIAVINSRRVREGELVGNARVVRIEEGVVTLDLDGQVREVSLHGGVSIKSRPAE